MSWAAARKLADKILADKKAQIAEPLEFFDDGSIRIGTQLYKPNATATKFRKSKDTVRMMVGPFGSGKSTICVAEILELLREMPLCKDGRRRMKVGVFRNTLAELETTTLQTWKDWTDELGHIQTRSKPTLQQTHTFYYKSVYTELSLLFIGLDHVKDIRKLKSFELSHALIEETCEIAEIVFDVLQGRIGRYPKRDFMEVPMRKRVICATNPFNVRHYLYRVFEHEKTDGFKVFHQPPGLIKNDAGSWIDNPKADNVEHLDENYYSMFARGKTQEFIKVFCLGLYGAIKAGKLVHPSYNDDLHAVETIEFDSDYPIYMGWDGGLTPACLLEQFIGGQRRTIKEFTTERMDLRELAELIVKPYLDTELAGYSFISTCDPAGGSKEDRFHVTQILKEVGIKTLIAPTNTLQPRLDAVNFFLNKLSIGKPCYILSKKGCPILREGFLGEYKYKRLSVIGDEKYRDEPEKLHPWSDIQDCGQYNSLKMLGYVRKEKRKDKTKVNSTMFARSEWC